MSKILIFLFLIFPFFSGKPAYRAHLYLESLSTRSTYAYQQTGSKGKVAFKYIEQGKYQLIAEFPQQGGKWIKEKRRHSTFTKSSYNPKNKTYYYQGNEGYFAVKLSGLKKIDKANIKGVFREKRGEEGIQIIITQLQATGNGANITISVKALTAAQFKRATDKIQDLSMISIPKVK